MKAEIIQLEKKHLAHLKQQRDLIDGSIKASERFIKEQETPDPVVPWEPKGGSHTVTYNGDVSSSINNNAAPHWPLAGRTFSTCEAAEQASKFFTFYQRYYSLAMEMNAKHEPTENEALWYLSLLKPKTWLTNRAPHYRDNTTLFTSHNAAQEAADIMNRDGWELPTP